MMASRGWAKQHPWTYGLAIALAACGLVELVLCVQLGRARARTRRADKDLREMQEVAFAYREQKTLAVQGSVRLRSPGSLSLEAVKRAASETGIDKNLGESGSHPVPHDDLLEQTVSLSLDAVRREDLLSFLLAVEDADPAIRTKTLQITPSKKQPEFVDAEVTFSAYEKRATAK